LIRLPLARATAEAIRPSTSPGLCFPTAHSGEEDPRFAGGATTRCVPPSGFGYPPDGLLPSTPGRVCFIPTALLGFPPAELRLPGGGNGFPRSPHPPAVRTRQSPVRDAPAGIATTGFRALALPRSPRTRDGCLANRGLDAPLGFTPSRASCRPSCPRLAPRAPLACFADETRPKANSPAGTLGYRSAADSPDSHPAGNRRSRGRQPS
jgi:hypothetical protein